MFPASAGMIPIESAIAVIRNNGPRKRGDDPRGSLSSHWFVSCSPQARG